MASKYQRASFIVDQTSSDADSIGKLVRLANRHPRGAFALCKGKVSRGHRSYLMVPAVRAARDRSVEQDFQALANRKMGERAVIQVWSKKARSRQDVHDEHEREVIQQAVNLYYTLSDIDAPLSQINSALVCFKDNMKPIMDRSRAFQQAIEQEQADARE